MRRSIDSCWQVRNVRAMRTRSRYHRVVKRAVLAILLVTVQVAYAGDDGTATGFEATGSGELTGRATDADGKPLRRVEIHVVSRSGGEQIVKTDDDGNYKVVLKGAPTETSMIFVRGHHGAHLGGAVAESTQIDGGEAIDIHETSAPAVAAKAVDRFIRILPYSDAAIRDDEWARAWFTLDLDAAGNVLHVKWMRRPGHGLDPIALAAAFDQKFEPARDRAKRAVPSQLVWMFEWPSHKWLLAHHDYDLTRMPDDYTKVACQAAGEHRHDRRDCSQADVTSTLGEAWIAKPKPKK
jgi:hypothetical protein